MMSALLRSRTAVFVMTASLFQKMKAGSARNALQKLYQDKTVLWWYQGDEYHQEPLDRLASSLARADAAILVGDPAQLERSEGRANLESGTIVLGSDDHRKVRSFDLPSAALWLRKNSVPHKIMAAGSRRLGPTIVQIIHDSTKALRWPCIGDGRRQ